MQLARRSLTYSIQVALLGTLATSTLGSGHLYAQSVGPGTVTAPVNVTTGTTTIVGNTTVDVRSGANNATNVSGGTLVVDMRAGSRPGAISLLTNGGNALYTNGGIISVPAGVNITTGTGAALYADGSAASLTLNGGLVTSLGGGYAAVARNGAQVSITSSNFNDPFYSGASAAGNGMVADAGGVITVAGTSSMATSGTNRVAFGASGAGSAININTPFTFSGGLSGVTMYGLGALGVYLYDGGAVNFSQPQTIVITGNSGVGVSVDQTTMATPINGLTVNFTATSGSGGSGAIVMRNGSAQLSNFVVTGPAAAVGVWTQAGTSATLTGSSRIDINSATNGQSWRIATTSLVNPIFGQVTAPSWRAGLLNLGGQMTSTGTTINANASGSYGAYAGANGTSNSTMSLANNTINATGSRTIGMMGYTNSQYVVSDSQITNTGGSVALYAWSYANPSNNQPIVSATTMSFTNSTITATGGAAGLWTVNQNKGLYANAISFDGGGLSSDGYAMLGQGVSDIAATNGASITGGQWLLYAEGINTSGGDAATLVNLSASGASRLSGLVEADSDSTANVTLTDRSSWVGKAFYASNVSVDGSSSWSIPASSVLSGTLTNNGLVAFTAPVANEFKSLYVHSYAGAGTLGINTVLGDDNSLTDRLIIDGGTATGTSRIAVTNVGGAGAETTGNGILVVQVANGGATSANAFALAGTVIAGPYAYLLHRGGVSPGVENDWFLRNTIECTTPGTPGCPAPPDPPDPPAPPPPPPPPPPAPPPDPVNPPTPDPGPPAPPVPDPVAPGGGEDPVTPVYRPEVSLYTALPAMALRYGWAMLDNLHERVGEEEQLRGRSDLREDDYLNALWVRVIGEDGNVRGASEGIYNGSPKYDYNIMALQAGMDVYAQEHDDRQRDHVGVTLGTGRIRSDVANYDGTDAGDDVVKGQSLGAYWTHFWTEGQYLDAVWQGTWGKYSAKSDDGIELHHDSFGWAASLEGGYPFHDDTQVWEPQAQVIYQHANSGTTSDIGATIRFSDITSLIGRVGLRWANTWIQQPGSDGSPRLLTGWLRANVWKEFKGEPVTSFSSADGYVPFQGSIKGSWWQLNGGVTWEWDRNASFYANVGYQNGFGSRGFHAWDAKVGMRWNW
ncbi:MULTISPECIES: autotransporter outer membrane beta-barrel domain-containing protein [Dyella]|nr:MULTISPECIES: autotransporter outer membrane beta-barrel domain-containing protein [Dyella]